MPEIVGTFARTELWDERANCSSEARNSSRRDLTEERLEFAVRQFDWIEVGRVFRQVAQRRVRFLNRLANGRPHVDAAVIHHDDVVAPERGNQALLDISEEHLSSHGTFDHHWGGHFIVAQGSHEGDRLPCSKRNGADHPVAPRTTPPDPRQVCADRGLVDKHQPGGIKHTLLSDPTSACSRHIRSLPFGSLQAFFKGDSVAIEKTPERATAGFESVACAALQRSPPKSGPAVGQSDRVSAPQTLPVEKRFLHAASAQRSCFRASAAATLPPNLRSPRNVQPSRAATHRLQQLRLRVPADHQNRTSASPAPATENQCTKIRSSLTLWESRRFKSGGNRFNPEFSHRGYVCVEANCRSALTSEVRHG